MLRDFLTSIADKLRELLGTTDTINAQNFTSKIDEVYEAGKSAGGGGGINPEWTDWRMFDYYDNRHDLFEKLKYSDTHNGINFSMMFNNCKKITTIPLIDTSNGTDFYQMFIGCNQLTTIPLIDTSNAKDLSSIFFNCSGLKTVPNLDTKNCLNFEKMFSSCRSLEAIPELDTSNGTNFSYMFYACANITTIPKINTSNNTNFTSMFYNCSKLITILEIDTSKGTSFSSMFDGCRELENITFVGTINKSISLSSSTKLTHDSLMSIINALADKIGQSGTFKLTIGATNVAKLTTEELEIIGAKGWTYA